MSSSKSPNLFSFATPETGLAENLAAALLGEHPLAGLVVVLVVGLDCIVVLAGVLADTAGADCLN